MRHKNVTTLYTMTRATVRRVRCRFCDFDRPVWFTTGGRRACGFNILANHVEMEHPKEWARLQRHLNDTCKTEPEPSP